MLADVCVCVCLCMCVCCVGAVGNFLTFGLDIEVSLCAAQRRLVVTPQPYIAERTIGHGSVTLLVVRGGAEYTMETNKVTTKPAIQLTLGQKVSVCLTWTMTQHQTAQEAFAFYQTRTCGGSGKVSFSSLSSLATTFVDWCPERKTILMDQKDGEDQDFRMFSSCHPDSGSLVMGAPQILQLSATRMLVRWRPCIDFASDVESTKLSVTSTEGDMAKDVDVKGLSALVLTVPSGKRTDIRATLVCKNVAGSSATASNNIDTWHYEPAVMHNVQLQTLPDVYRGQRHQLTAGE